MKHDAPIADPPASRRLLDKLLLHGQVTRRQIGEGFGMSKVAASKHVDWLKRHRLAHSREMRLPDVRRPVEVLSVNDQLATAMGIELSSSQTTVGLVGAGAKLLDEQRFAVRSASQASVLDSVREAAGWASQRVRSMKRSLHLAGLSVTGYLEPTSGMIFNVAGIADWAPCHLGDVVAELSGVVTLPWTSVSCRLRGLSRRVGVDHRLGYLAYAGGRLAVATLMHGSVAMGRFGTGGGAVHQSVSDATHVCICGRRGCLDEHLRRGDASPDMVMAAVPGVLRAMRALTVGIEWPCESRALEDLCREAGINALHRIDPGDVDALEREGLHLACARAMLNDAMTRLRRGRARRVVNHEAFKPLADAGADPVSHR